MQSIKGRTKTSYRINVDRFKDDKLNPIIFLIKLMVQTLQLKGRAGLLD